MPDYEDEDNVRVPIPDDPISMSDSNAKVVQLKRMPRVLSSAQFVAGFVPPDYLIDGMLQRRFFYSLTGKTGAGKTSIMLLLAAHSALNRKLLDHEVDGGKVVYLAGENADDVRMRWIAMAQQLDFDINAIEVYFIPGTFKITEMFERVRAEIALRGEIAAIFIDTSAAFFEGIDENDNKQAGDHARLLRRILRDAGATMHHRCLPSLEERIGRQSRAARRRRIPRRGRWQHRGPSVGRQRGNIRAG